MPTSYEFHNYAAQLDDLADTAETLARGPQGLAGSDVVTGGALGTAVAATLSSAEVNGAVAAATLRSLADTCRHRAWVTAAHDAAMVDYQRDLIQYRRQVDRMTPIERRLNPVRRPNPPATPPAWVN